MPKSEITKAPGTDVSRPRDLFAAMREEMDNMFDRLERGYSHWPSLFRHDSTGAILPELDVRESAAGITVEAELPGVTDKDISVMLAKES